MERLIHRLLRHRAWVLLGLAVLTALFAAALPRAQVRSTLTGLFFDDDSEFVHFRKRALPFGTDEVLVVGFPAAAPLAADTITRLERAVRAVEDLPEVERVTSILDSTRVVADAEGAEIRRFVDEARRPGADRLQLERELTLDRRSRGIVISPAGTDLAVLIELVDDEHRPAEAGPAFVRAVVDRFEGAGFERASLHLDGPVAVIGGLVDETYRNIYKLLPLSVLALAATGLVLFRRIFPIAITLAVSGIAVVWTFGAAIWVNPEVNIFLSIAPLFILVLGFSEVVHLSNAYLLELSAGRAKVDAIVASAAEVGEACLLTSATTVLGFASLALVPTPLMRSFGLTLAAGVGTTLVASLALTPIVLSYLPVPHTVAPGTRGHGGLVGRIITFCDGLTSRHPRAVIGGFAVILAIAAVGFIGVRVDTSFMDRFSPSSRLRRDHAYFTERFAGTDYVTVLLDTPARDGWVDPERVQALAAYVTTLEREAGVDRALSLVDLLDGLDRAIRPEIPRPTADRGFGPMPASREAIAQYLLLHEMGASPADVARLLDTERRTTQVLLRVEGLPLRALNELGKRAASLAPSYFGDSVHVQVGGVFFFLGGWLDNMVIGQTRGLVFSILTISVVVAIGLRSVRTGLGAMIPNLLPLCFLGGWLGHTYDAVDSDAMVVMMIALGIADDDTIHFITRLREEAHRATTVAEAVSRTFHYSGRAIITTALILVVGFLPLATSDYLSIRMLGTYLPGTIFVAVLTEVFVTPALVHLGVIRIVPLGGARDALEG
ncbi:MAG: MMPL family transporter [bacterium]